MNLKDFNNLSTALLARAQQVRDSKRPSYTVNSPDVLANFKNTGARQHLDPHKVLRIFQEKQQDAVDTRHDYPELAASEPDLDRYADIINYALLDFALLMEKENPVLYADSQPVTTTYDPRQGQAVLAPKTLFEGSPGTSPRPGWHDKTVEYCDDGHHGHYGHEIIRDSDPGDEHDPRVHRQRRRP